MRTLCLNLDQTDAEFLRDAVRAQIAALPVPSDLTMVDDRASSLMATLHLLTTMIDRPAPARRGIRDLSATQSVTPLRRVR